MTLPLSDQFWFYGFYGLAISMLLVIYLIFSF
ncbi:DUF3961 domain-containing protein [Bacillus cytotoxicus]|nr:DUF3961 domain-containing protein [Bacillus cytotoxicus]MDH2878231.1 DUF3961 domain-containing protein [Bacillus cytotoxicus]